MNLSNNICSLSGEGLKSWRADGESRKHLNSQSGINTTDGTLSLFSCLAAVPTSMGHFFKIVIALQKQIYLQ